MLRAVIYTLVPVGIMNCDRKNMNCDRKNRKECNMSWIKAAGQQSVGPEITLFPLDRILFSQLHVSGIIRTPQKPAFGKKSQELHALATQLMSDEVNIEDIPPINVFSFNMSSKFRVVSFNNRRLWCYYFVYIMMGKNPAIEIPVKFMTVDELQSLSGNLDVPCSVSKGCMIPGRQFEDVIIRYDKNEYTLLKYVETFVLPIWRTIGLVKPLSET